MGSRVRDAALLAAAVIALIAFGLLIVWTRSDGPTAGTSPSPTASFAPAPAISVTVAPVPNTAAPLPVPSTPLPPRLTTPPIASP